MGLINNVQKRKLRVVKDLNDGRTLMIRAHLRTDSAHQNQTYLEVFTYLGNDIRLDSVINNDILSSTWNITDFTVNEFDLIVLTNSRFWVLPLEFLFNPVLAGILNTNNCTNPEAFATSETNDNQYRIYAVCNGKLAVFAEQLQVWVPIRPISQPVTSMYITRDYIIVNHLN